MVSLCIICALTRTVFILVHNCYEDTIDEFSIRIEKIHCNQCENNYRLRYVFFWTEIQIMIAWKFRRKKVLQSIGGFLNHPKDSGWSNFNCLRINLASSIGISPFILMKNIYIREKPKFNTWNILLVPNWYCLIQQQLYIFKQCVTS